jgi:hypothetical protein
VNGSGSQEDPYLSPAKIFFIIWLFGSGIMVLKSLLPNPDGSSTEYNDYYIM